jgi:hypothetical protein
MSAPIFVQQTALGTSSSVATVTSGAFATPPSVNNTIVVFAWGTYGLSQAAPSCSDTYGNDYLQVGSVQPFVNGANGIWVAMFAAVVVATGSGLQVTITDSIGSETHMLCCAAEFTNVGPYEAQVGSDSLSVTTSYTTGNVSINGTDLILAAFINDYAGTSNLVDPGGAWTEIQDSTDGNASYVVGSAFQVSASSPTPTATWSQGITQGANWAGLVVALRDPFNKIQYVTSTGTITIPADWNPNASRIDCIGEGGNGAARQSATTAGCGGGGGAWASSNNVALGQPGTAITVQVGGGGSGLDTMIQNTSGVTKVQADNGTNATLSAAGTGGLTANCIGQLRFSGGSGRKVGAGSSNGGGGGGAASMVGLGFTAASGTGGASGSNLAGSAVNVAGRNGTEYDATHGSGSGAGGGSAAGHNGALGGRYGAGGGGSGVGASDVGGAGNTGLIVLMWNPDPSGTSLPSMSGLAGV